MYDSVYVAKKDQGTNKVEAEYTNGKLLSGVNALKNVNAHTEMALILSMLIHV